jgi:apolipoprotein N-acyltransferase
MICFESIFNYKRINRNICQSDLVIQISNDSWFGKWYGPQQHLANSLLRSIEFGKTLVRSTPSGISAIIDKNGNINQAIPNDKKDFLYYNYPITKSSQVCSSTLNFVIFLLLLIFGSSFLYVRIKK